MGAEQEEEGGLLKAKAVNEVDAERGRATPEDGGGEGGGFRHDFFQGSCSE